MEACSRWKRHIVVNSMQANEAPQERMSAAWRLHKRGCEPRRGSVMVKTIDATTTDRLRRSPLYLDLSPSCARKRACMELTIISRFQRLQASRKYSLHSLFFDFLSAFAFGMLGDAWIIYRLQRNMPKACPYVMMQFVRPPIVDDINHRICLDINLHFYGLLVCL